MATPTPTDHPKRTERVELRATPAEKERILAEADARGQSLTVFILRAVEEELKR